MELFVAAFWETSWWIAVIPHWAANGSAAQRQRRQSASMILHLRWWLFELTQQKNRSQSVLKTTKRSLKGQTPRIDATLLTSVCGDTLRRVLSSQASQTKLSVLHVQFSSSPLSTYPYSRWETHGGSAAIDRALHRCSFYLLFFFICFNTTFLASLSYFIPTSLRFSLFFFSLLNVPSPSLFLTLHCLFSDSKMWVFLYI